MFHEMWGEWHFREANYVCSDFDWMFAENYAARWCCAKGSWNGFAWLQWMIWRCQLEMLKCCYFAAVPAGEMVQVFSVKSVRESDLQWLKRCNNVFTIARSFSLSISHVDESQHVRPYPSHTCSAVLSEIWVTRFHVLLLVPIETTGSITSANNAVETNWDFVSTDWSPSWAFKELPTFHTFSPSTTCLKGICDTSLCPRRIWIRIVTCVFSSWNESLKLSSRVAHNEELWSMPRCL